MRCWRRRACSYRFALSASRDRRLTVAVAWPGSVPAAGGSAAARTAACRSGWRWMNERCTRGWAATRHAERDGLAGLADHGDGLLDLVTVGVADGGQVVLDTADQRPQLVDLLLGRGQVLAGPVLQVGGGAQAFPVGEQLLQVGLQFGQVGRVAAEVP